jgi:dienelactone hydrolase
LWALQVLYLAAGCDSESGSAYLEQRANFTTNLITRGAAPQQSEPAMFGDWEFPAERVREVMYPSDSLLLKALLYVPSDADARRYPALVYLHAGVGVGPATLPNCKPFIEAGFAVMVPMLRGENDNPGFHEFMLSEVDDAAAAVQWLTEQPYIDHERVYLLGWSYGGGIAALLSLLEDVPVRHSASIGGLASAETFDELLPLPFDHTDPAEREMRVLVGHLRWMQHKHYAYVGSADLLTVGAVDAARREMDEASSLLEMTMIPGGDHYSIFTTAINRHLELIQQEEGGSERR